MVDAGMSDSSTNFQVQYDLNPPFDLNCAGCCFQYLTEDRQYQWVEDIWMVKYDNAVTSCYVDGKQGKGGAHGVVKTGHDLNLGLIGPRLVNQSHSYQLYGPVAPHGLAVGAHMTARIEAIAVTQITNRMKVKDCYFSYADATLLELYRQQNGKPSLAGQCCWPPPQDCEPAQGSVAALIGRFDQIDLNQTYWPRR